VSRSRARYLSVLDPLDWAEQNPAKPLHMHLRIHLRPRVLSRVGRRARLPREQVFRGLDLLGWRNDGLFSGYRLVVGLGEEGGKGEDLRRGGVLVRWMVDLGRLGMVMGLRGLVPELRLLLLHGLRVRIRSLGVMRVIRRFLVFFIAHVFES
jgi:hypothetical protein